MKRVLIFSDKWENGGIESFIMNLVRCLNKDKYLLTIVCAKKRD